MASLSLEFGVAGRIAPGQQVSGDLEVVHYYNRGGAALVAVIDGIGHGEHAAATARRAADALLAAPQHPPATLLSRCHVALRGTRGVVLSVASIDLQHALLSWLGVGNVTGVVSRGASGIVGGHEELLSRPGVLGYGELPTLQAAVIPLRARDTLIFATDGVSRHFSDELPVGSSPQALADDIISRHCSGNDDALVVVARAG
jgi:serine phosphatase RsbU (regulator of sigma subunit)